MDTSLKKTKKRNRLKEEIYDISDGDLEKLTKNLNIFNKYKNIIIIGIFIIMAVVAVIVPKENFRYVALCAIIYVNILLLSKLFLENLRVTLLWYGIDHVLGMVGENSDVTLNDTFGLIDSQETKLLLGKKISPILDNIEKLMSYIRKCILEEKKNEHMVDELIEKVASELSKPVNSMINDLENIRANDEINNDVVINLDKTASKLKKSIEDLIELSKAASGTLELNKEVMDVGSLLKQAMVEFGDEILEAGINIHKNIDEKKQYVSIDGEKTWRVFGILIDNIVKYSYEKSMVFIEVKAIKDKTIIEFKNISKEPLNISSEDFMKKLKGNKIINHEGSGLGLAIASSIITSQGGIFDISIDGDLFKVAIEFDTVKERGE